MIDDIVSPELRLALDRWKVLIIEQPEHSKDEMQCILWIIEAELKKEINQDNK